MRNYIYKMVIFVLAIIIIFEFTIGKQLNNLNQKINFLSTQEGRRELVASLKKEIKKANEKENYLDAEERELLRNFIMKIKKELKLNN